MPDDDDHPAPLSGYARLPGHLDLPAVLAEALVAEAAARGVSWQAVVGELVAGWELRRHRRRRP